MSELSTEQKLTDLESKYTQAQAELVESRKQLQLVERRGEIDRMLIAEEAVDLETVRLLTEIAVGRMDEEDVKLAVEDLKSSKPFLFRRREKPGGGAMAARPRVASRPVEDAAEEAAASGNRNDLLRYLRVRRKGR